MEDNLVSIVIPCYNYEDHVGEAIESALEQSYETTEVIVVDDGSTDGSLEVIRTFKDYITWRTGENRGACNARNRGLGLASGEFIKFLDADDALRENVVELQVRQSRVLGEVRAIVFGELLEGKDTRPSSEQASLEYLVGPGIHTSCPLFPRNLLEEVGGFEEGLPCRQDYDLTIRMHLAGMRFIYRPSVALRTSRASSGITERTSPRRNPDPRMKMYRRTASLLRRSLDGTLPKPVASALAKKWWHTGRLALRGGHKSEAEECFETARELDEQAMVGSEGYRLLVRLFGPIAAERIATLMKRIGLRPSVSRHERELAHAD